MAHSERQKHVVPFPFLSRHGLAKDPQTCWTYSREAIHPTDIPVPISIITIQPDSGWTPGKGTPVLP